jgi:hypothetical protein
LDTQVAVLTANLIDLKPKVDEFRDKSPNLEAEACGTTALEKITRQYDYKCIKAKKSKLDEEYCKKACLEYKSSSKTCHAAQSNHVCKISTTKVAKSGTNDPKKGTCKTKGTNQTFVGINGICIDPLTGITVRDIQYDTWRPENCDTDTSWTFAQRIECEVEWCKQKCLSMMNGDFTSDRC